MSMQPFRSEQGMPDLFDEVTNFAMQPFEGTLSMQRVWAPEVDISENDKQISLDLNAPGFEKGDINVDIDGNVLILKGKHSERHKEDRGTYHRRERRTQSFERKFTMPEYADVDRIKARMLHGVLHLDVPKKEHALQQKARHVQIQ